jgi:hypothetical protein
MKKWAGMVFGREKLFRTWLITYQRDQFLCLLKPSCDKTKHLHDEVVYSIGLLRCELAILKQEVHKDVQTPSQVLRGLKSSQTVQIIIDQLHDSFFFLKWNQITESLPERVRPR